MKQFGVKNINAILPPPQPPQPMDPSLEHIMAISGKPFQAYPGQDHKAHIDAHLSFMSISMVQNNPDGNDVFTKKYFRTH